MAKKVNEKRSFPTPYFRVAFPHLFTPVGMKGSDKKSYSITMLFDKKADLSVLKEAIIAAKIDEFGPDKNRWPKCESPVRNGDDPKYADKEGYKGCYAIKASNAQIKPVLVDNNRNEILDEASIYPGCWARAYVFARVWEFGGSYGVHFILDGVQKYKDDTSFSSRPSPNDMFDAIPMEGDDFDGGSDFESADFESEEMSF